MERKIEENVNVLNSETEQAALPNDGAKSGASDTRGSAVFRKFKDANALAEAYGALEAEFTRRSQRLKELERRLAEYSSGDGAEKPRSNEIEREGESENEANKVAVQPDETNGYGAKKTVVVGGESVATNAVDVESRGQGCGEALSSDGEKATESVVAPSAEIDVASLSEDDIYRVASENEAVRVKIVGEYLASLKGAGVPLSRGGVGAVVSPVAKAKSVAEAGNMALRFFKGAN